MDTFKMLNDNTYLSKINVAGTHDSCTAFVSLENMSRCQNLTVRQQLDMGIRLFDIRLHKFKSEFYLIHGLADCYSDKSKSNRLTFDEVLCDFSDFLKANPEETLIISVKQDRGIMRRSFFTAFYKKYIENNEDKWFLKNENPILSQCRGKMVLMRRCKRQRRFLSDEVCGLDFSFWPDQSGKKKTKTEKFVISVDKSATEPFVIETEIQDRYSLACERKWFDCAKDFLDRCECSDKMICVHFISTSYRNKGETLVKTAEKMNRLFGEYELRKDAAHGWFLLDFPTRELCEKIIKSNCEIYKLTGAEPDMV